MPYIYPGVTGVYSYSRAIENAMAPERTANADETKAKAGFATGGLASFAKQNADSAKSAVLSGGGSTPRPRGNLPAGVGTKVDVAA